LTPFAHALNIRPTASAVVVGEVLNASRAPGAAWITVFTSASRTGVCAGSNRTPPPITTTSTGRAASAARAAAPPPPPRPANQQPFEVVPHPPDALLISLDPARNDIRVEWLALEELAVEVDRIGIQPDRQHSLAHHSSPSASPVTSHLSS
jgi:hypothetical protein